MDKIEVIVKLSEYIIVRCILNKFKKECEIRC
nr:MAG TPA: hypothetical protein [Caudoviricetes sp.]